MIRFRFFLGILLFTAVYGVDRSKFITCEKSGFCRRNRDSSGGELSLDAQSISSGVDLSGKLTRAGAETNLALSVHAYAKNIYRLRVQEAGDVEKQRFQALDIINNEFLQPGEPFIESGQEYKSSSGDSSATLNTESLSLEFSSAGELDLVINARKLLTFEQKNAFAEALEADDDPDGLGEEKFGSHTDTKPYGPTAVGIDATFVGSKHVYGIPEHASSLALQNTKGDGIEKDPYRLFNLDVFEFELDEMMALYGSVPFMLSHKPGKTVGFFWNNPSETWIDIEDGPNGKDTHWFSEAGVIDLFVFMGPTAADVFDQYTGVTGRPYLPPVFSTAYHQCRWNYRDEEDVRQVDAGFDEHNIPYDVIWLDIEHTDGKRYFTWDKDKFPTPEEMQNNIAAKGRKMVTIIDPHIKRDGNYWLHSEAESKGNLYVKNVKGEDFDGWCWPGSSSYLDYTSEIVRTWWAEQFDYAKYKGSSNILHTWNDMNEPSVFNGPEVSMPRDNLHAGGFEHREVHNIYGYYMQQATHDGLLQRNPERNSRPFVLSRAFYAGSQRWGAIWTGDNTGTWEHLHSSIPMILSLSLAGITFSGADVGGFFEPEQDSTLLTRWYQMGAYQPFFRAHGHLDTKRREPWLFDEPKTSIIRQAIQDRYSILPFIYTLFEEAHRTGMPINRPLWVEFPEDESVFAMENEFMLGSALLVKPPTSLTSTDVYLPTGRWFDIKNWKEYAGPLTQPFTTKLDKIPVFQRGGTIIPKKERQRRSSTQMVNDPYTVQIALDDSNTAAGNLYVDDGESYNYQSGEYLRSQFTFSEGTLSYEVTHSGHQAGNQVERIRLLGMACPSSVLDNQGNAKQFECEKNVVVVRAPGLAIAQSWSLKFA